MWSARNSVSACPFMCAPIPTLFLQDDAYDYAPNPQRGSARGSARGAARGAGRGASFQQQVHFVSRDDDQYALSGGYQARTAYPSRNDEAYPNARSAHAGQGYAFFCEFFFLCFFT
jgi:hypothetical protein